MAQHDKEVVEITILNWDKYQRPLKGKGGANSRRKWVAISVDLDLDHDYCELPLVEKLCWVHLMLHAGRVGPVYELSPSRARVMWGLHRSPDFSLLENQGFIKSRVTCKSQKVPLHNRTGHNKENTKKVLQKPKPKIWGAAPAGVDAEAWKNWAEYKRGSPHKSTLTKAGDFLRKYPPEAQRDIVDTSIRNTWKGLFAPKGDGKQIVDEAEQRKKQLDELAKLLRIDRGVDEPDGTFYTRVEAANRGRIERLGR